jgi:hypothetical protein
MPPLQVTTAMQRVRSLAPIERVTSTLEQAEGWRRAIEFVANSDMRGNVSEFGCYRGTSLSALDHAIIAFEALTERRFIDRLFAFDSFAGMPEAGTRDRLDGYELALGTLTPGKYACSIPEFRDALRTNGVALDRVEIIEGSFERSLRDPAVAERTANSRCALLHIDRDFEVSARDALRFMTPRLQDRPSSCSTIGSCSVAAPIVARARRSKAGCRHRDTPRRQTTLTPGSAPRSSCTHVIEPRHHALIFSAVTLSRLSEPSMTIFSRATASTATFLAKKRASAIDSSSAS